ncbi:MAG: hypothetical protein QM278_02250 [Pseudomonadota bacterium]|nr:hypothetical protein [Pseudomonadota bacterium]
MDLQLLDSVRQLLTEVERLAGEKIAGTGKPELAAPIDLRLGGRGEPRLVLDYRPNPEEDVNFLVANQAGHLLRFFAAPAAARFVSVANRRTMASFILETESELERLVAVFSRDRVRRMIARWYQGLVFQLTRMPADIMVHKWLHDRFPELRRLQLQDLSAQRRQARQALSPAVRLATPARIYRAANIMNYVFFKNLEDCLHGDFTAPYHETIFILDAAALLRITAARQEDNHAGDRAMIDAWATALELGHWYEWRSYENFSSPC